MSKETKMTKEEIFILEYLNQNYEVITTSHSFAVLDNTSKKIKDITSFRIDIGNIFMETSYSIIDNWFDENSELLIKDLNNIIHQLDFTKSKTEFILLELLLEVEVKSEIKSKYDITFIKNMFFEHHKKQNIIPRLNMMTHKIQNSNDIMDIIAEFIEIEPANIRDFIIEYLNDWYVTNILGDKITDFLRQLVITLGPSNWKVTWIGHGELTKDKLKYFFYNESESIFKIIVKKYKTWYDNEIIEYSEKMIKNNLVY